MVQHTKIINLSVTAYLLQIVIEYFNHLSFYIIFLWYEYSE